MGSNPTSGTSKLVRFSVVGAIEKTKPPASGRGWQQDPVVTPITRSEPILAPTVSCYHHMVRCPNKSWKRRQRSDLKVVTIRNLCSRSLVARMPGFHLGEEGSKPFESTRPVPGYVIQAHVTVGNQGDQSLGRSSSGRRHRTFNPAEETPIVGSNPTRPTKVRP